MFGTEPHPAGGGRVVSCSPPRPSQYLHANSWGSEGSQQISDSRRRRPFAGILKSKQQQLHAQYVPETTISGGQHRSITVNYLRIVRGDRRWSGHPRLIFQAGHAGSIPVTRSNSYDLARGHLPAGALYLNPIHGLQLDRSHL